MSVRNLKERRKCKPKNKKERRNDMRNIYFDEFIRYLISRFDSEEQMHLNLLYNKFCMMDDFAERKKNSSLEIDSSDAIREIDLLKKAIRQLGE